VALVRDVVRELGSSAEIREVEVKSTADAAKFRFLGSPTIHVDGADVDPAAENRTDYSLGCRVYGRAGVPPRAWVAGALRARMDAKRA